MTKQITNCIHLLLHLFPRIDVRREINPLEGETIGITKEEANDLAAFLRENAIKIWQANAKGLFCGPISA